MPERPPPIPAQHSKPVFGSIHPQITRLCSMTHDEATKLDTVSNTPSLSEYFKVL